MLIFFIQVGKSAEKKGGLIISSVGIIIEK